MSKEIVDLYELLEIASNAGEKELTKAYRVKALKYHPDKNRDKPEITQIFHDIKTAYDTLSDAKKRAEYDEQRRAQIAKRQRQDALSGHRKKMKTQLEADELRARQSREAELMRAQSMHDEAARFRKESLRDDSRRDKKMRDHVQRMQQMEADDEREREERKRQAAAVMADVDELDRSIRVRWDPSEGNVDQEQLAAAFAQFGELEEVVVAPMSGNGRKRGKQQSALLVFKSIAAAHALMNVQHESPQIRRFSRFWAAGKEPDAVHSITGMAPRAPRGHTFASNNSGASGAQGQTARPDISELALDRIPGIEMDFADFEALTLMRMREHQQPKSTPT